jgi:hypothetical protein
VLTPQFGKFYGPENLFGATQSAWVANSRGYAIGEWITVSFPNSRRISGLSVSDGYQKNSDIFFKNTRVKSLEVITSSGFKGNFELHEGFGSQLLSFNRAVQAQWIQLIIRDVYPGSKGMQ